MALPTHEYREVLCYDFMKRLTQEESYKTFITTFGKQDSSAATAFKWYNVFFSKENIASKMKAD